VGSLPLNLSASSSAKGQFDTGGATSGAGAWSVNLGGSGTALQSASSGSLNWMLIAGALAVYIFLK